MRAQSVGYFTDRWLVSATGEVSARAGSRSITADAIRYDLSTDRLLATGNVHVSDVAACSPCAAYSLLLRTGEQHYIVTEPEPRSFHLSAGAAPAEAPAPPGTFETPDLGGAVPYIRGKRSTIIPQTSVRMTPASFPTPVGPTPELPTFLYTFAGNPNLYQTSLPTATLDQPFGITGTETTYTQLRLRYDTNYGAGAGIEQHFIDGNRAYLAIAAIAGRSPSLDLLGYTQLGKRATVNLSASSFLGNNSAQARLTYSIPSANGALTFYQYDHYSTQSFQISTPDRYVPHLFGYRFTGGYAHSFSPGLTPFESDWYTTLGGSIYTLPSLRGPLQTYLSAHFDYALTNFDFPHDTLSTNLTFTAARTLPHHIGLFASASFAQFDNRYANPAYLNLPSQQYPYYAPDGTPFPGYFAYAGLSTSRTYYLSTTYEPSPLFRTVIGYTHADDFPPQFHGYGRPPNSVSFDFRVRITRTIGLEYTRTYNFGWGGQYFAPGASLTLTP